MLPVLNKIDLPASDLDKTNKQIEDVIGIDTSKTINCSGKTGEGVDDILESIVKILPPPKGNFEDPLKCLLVDSWYDSYLGVIILVRVINGQLKKNQKISFNNILYIESKEKVWGSVLYLDVIEGEKEKKFQFSVVQDWVKYPLSAPTKFLKVDWSGLVKYIKDRQIVTK